MREIKFRAWDTANKKWAFNGFNLLGEVMMFDLLKNYRLENHTEFTIEQYTGLKDASGTEIYEGDVLRADWPDSPIVVVSWRKELCTFISRDDRGWYKPTSWSRCLIIGNIHDNPELVETE